MLGDVIGTLEDSRVTPSLEEVEHTCLSRQNSSTYKSMDADDRLTAIIDDVASTYAQFTDSICKESIYKQQKLQVADDGRNNWCSVPSSLSQRKKATIMKCEYCGIMLKHPSKIEAHMRTHTGEKPFECQHCGMRFSQRTPMRMHVRRHMGLTPYACSWDCGKRFVSNALRNAHEVKAHIGDEMRGPPRPHLKPQRQSVPFTMVKTDFNILSWDQIDEKQEVAEQKQRDKMDEIIDAVASGNTSPKSRKMRKRNAIVAQCGDCGLVLKHPSKIQAHIRTHSGERPFKCNFCDMCFAAANAMRVHERRVHTGEKPYECTWECGRKFVSVSARNEHERVVHAGIKRYQCTDGKCRRLFTRRRYLMMHQAKAHALVDNSVEGVLNMVRQECETEEITTWPVDMTDTTGQETWIENGIEIGDEAEFFAVDFDESSTVQFGSARTASLNVVGISDNVEDMPNNEVVITAHLSIDPVPENFLEDDEGPSETYSVEEH